MPKSTIPNTKAQFGTKARMLTLTKPWSLIGHAVGGICPFALNEGVTVYLDRSLQRFETVFPACGSGNSAIELTIPELERYSTTRRGLMSAKAGTRTAKHLREGPGLLPVTA